MNQFHLRRIAVISALLTLPLASLHAQISGFNSGVGYAENDNGNGTAFYPSANTLEVTQNTYGDAVSDYYTTPQSAGQFYASFTYQLNSNVLNDGLSPADGVAFVIQASALNALGGSGGYLGYNGVGNSIAVGLNVYSGNGAGTNLFTNGNETLTYIGTGSVSLTSFDPIGVQLLYDGTTLVENLTDLTTSQTFSTSYVVNIPSLLGGSSGWVGFSGGTGSGTSIQTISNFQYSATPEPSSLFGLGLPAVGFLFRKFRKSRS